MANDEIYISNELLRESSDEELEDVIKDCQERLFEMRHQQASLKGLTMKRHHIIKATKKLIARAKTILNERKYNIN